MGKAQAIAVTTEIMALQLIYKKSCGVCSLKGKRATGKHVRKE